MDTATFLITFKMLKLSCIYILWIVWISNYDISYLGTGSEYKTQQSATAQYSHFRHWLARD